MNRLKWSWAPLTVATAFLAFALVGCAAKDEAATDAAASAVGSPTVAGESTAVATNDAKAGESGWLTSLDEGIAKAKAENKMVLVDFSAEW